MKRFISVILACSLLFLIPANTFAAEPTGDGSTTEIFSYVNDRGDVIRIETNVLAESVNTKVYLNDILSQESTYINECNIVTTNIYDTLGNISSTSSLDVDSIYSTSATSTIISNPDTNLQPIASEFAPNAIVPVDPGDGGGSSSLPPRDVTDEPADNRGLQYTHRTGGKDYYYLGCGSDSFDPSLTAYIYRAYEFTYIGQTRHWEWTQGTTISAIWAVLRAYLSPTIYDALLVLFEFTYELVLEYSQAAILETYSFDHYYTVVVEGQTCLTPERTRTYWKLSNSLTSAYAWDEKDFISGFSMSNQEMIRIAIMSYHENN